MKKTILLAQLCIALATLVLGSQAWLAGQRLEALLILGAGTAWVLGCQQSLAWLDLLMLVLFSLLVVYGIYRDRPNLPGFIAIIGALAGWNLNYLKRRLEFSSNPGIHQQLFSNHIRRSSILVAIAVFLATIGYFVKLELRLGVAILVSALGIVSLSQLVGYLLKQKQ